MRVPMIMAMIMGTLMVVGMVVMGVPFMMVCHYIPLLNKLLSTTETVNFALHRGRKLRTKRPLI
jgi:hypothetical protein